MRSTLRGNTHSMMLHVMLARPHRGSLKGLCGATVKDLYVSKVPTDGRRSPNVCPVCRALASKTAAQEQENEENHKAVSSGDAAAS